MVNRAALEHDPIPLRIVKGHVYHKPHGIPYAHGCNPKLIRDLTEYWDGVDLDLRINKQKRGQCCHQECPTKKDAWFDPKHKINDRHKVQTLTNAECDRLRVKYKGSNRLLMSDVKAMQVCKNQGKIPCFEAKSDSGRNLFYDPEWWDGFRNRSIKVGIIPVVMSLPGSSKYNPGIKKLAAAHEAGLVTMLLWRGAYPDSWNKHLDLVKSRPKHPIYRV